MDTIESLMKTYTDKIKTLAEQDCAQRIRREIGTVLTNTGKTAPRHTRDGRKKAPPQLCPVPNCKEKAAPVYGMVCGGHRNLPKKLITKYRELRRIKAIKAGKK